MRGEKDPPSNSMGAAQCASCDCCAATLWQRHQTWPGEDFIASVNFTDLQPRMKWYGWSGTMHRAAHRLHLGQQEGHDAEPTDTGIMLLPCSFRCGPLREPLGGP